MKALKDMHSNLWIVIVNMIKNCSSIKKEPEEFAHIFQLIVK